MWMQQGRNWHFGEIEFFGDYENIDPRLHFDNMFHVYTLINYIIIKLIRFRYDFLAFNGKSKKQIRHLNMLISP